MNLINKIFYILGEKYRYQILLIFILILIGTILETFSIALIFPALLLLSNPDDLLNNQLVTDYLYFLKQFSQMELIILGMIVILLSYLTKALFLFFLIWKQNSFSFNLQGYIAERIFKSYFDQPYIFHLQRNSAELIRNITFEVQQLSNGIFIQGLALLTEIFIFSAIILLLAFVQPVGTAVILAASLFLGSIYYFIMKNFWTSWGEERQFNEGFRLKHLQQGLSAIKDVILLGRKNNFINKFVKHNQLIVNVSRLQNTFQQFPRIAIEFFGVLMLFLLVVFLIFQNYTVQELIAYCALFAAAAFRILPSINRIISAISSVRFTMPAINTVYEELVSADKINLVIKSKHLNNDEVDDEIISLNNIFFKHYGTTNKTLDDINIKIKRGSVIGIIGPSGSGKSTLIDVILGLLKPEKGTVNYKGLNIYNDIGGYQKKIGYVPQNIYLSDDTLLKNIAFGIDDKSINIDSIKGVIKSAQLSEFVSSLPENVDTIVGERGARISGGQRQRVGIARAIYHNPEILILDEATSSLDELTEKEIMKSIYEFKGQKTIIIVTHRLSTISECDIVYTLSDGKIISEDLPINIINR